MASFAAKVDTVTNDVLSAWSGSRDPDTVLSGAEWVLMTAEKYSEVSGNLRHPQGGGPAWRKDASGDIVAKPDTRPILDITLDKTEAVTGEAIQFSFQVKDAGGNNLSVNATRDLGLVSDNGMRWFKVSVTDGTKTGSKSFSQAGGYRFRGDGSYRVQGDIAFTIFENF